MRLVRLENWGTGLVVPDGTDNPAVVDVSAAAAVLAASHPAAAEVIAGLVPSGAGSDLTGWRELIACWAGAKPALETLLAARAATPDRYAAVTTPYANAAHLPPLPSPVGRIFAAGANVAAHASKALTEATGETVEEHHLVAEKRKGLPPWGFTVLPSTVVGDGATVVPPPGIEKFDYEAELAAVVGTGGRGLAVTDVEFWAFGPFCDFSVRDQYVGVGTPIDRGPLVWALTKNFETGNSLGPWLTTVDDGVDVNDVELDLTVNGELRQSFSTAAMIYSFAEIASHISRFVELHPGDIILSGTGAGTAVEQGVDGPYLKSGDRVAVTVRGGGRLDNTVRFER